MFTKREAAILVVAEKICREYGDNGSWTQGDGIGCMTCACETAADTLSNLLISATYYREDTNIHEAQQELGELTYREMIGSVDAS